MKKGEDYIGISVVFYCHDGSGRLLLNKRSKKCRDEIGCWDPGGGAMRFGETFESAVKREIREEYCVRPIKLDYICATNVIRFHNGKKTHWISVIFAAQVNPKKVRNGDPVKIDEIGWFTPDNFPNPLHSMFLKHFEYVKKAGVL